MVRFLLQRGLKLDRTEAQRIHRTMSEELEALRADLAELKRRESALVKLVEGVEELFPEDIGEPNTEIRARDYVKSKVPRGQEAIERVLAESPHSYLTVAEVVEAQASHGWADASDHKAADAVRTTLYRMWKGKKVARRKQGSAYGYRLKNKLDATDGESKASSLPLSTERTDHGPALTD